MKPYASILLFVSLLIAALPASAFAQGQAEESPALPLVEDFLFAQPHDELAMREGAYDCSEALGAQALCLDGHEYLGTRWDMILEFDSEKLTTVSMFTPFTRETYLAVFRELAREFRLVAMQSKEPTLDIVALEKTEGPSAPYSGTVVDYEARGIAERALAYVMLEAAALSPEPAESAIDMRQKAHPAVREVGVVLSVDTNGNDMLSLSFSRPRLVVEKP